MSIICLLDQTTHETREDLHAHLRGKLKQESYYLTYHPRVDLADGRPIPFKNVDQYLSSDFVDKNSLKKWLKAGSSAAKDWAIEWLKKRKAEKGLIYAPSETELRTLMAPTMEYYDKIGGYYNIAKSLGFQDRYTSETPVFNTFSESVSFIQDTREQDPIKLSFATTKATLNVGDYALSAPYDKGIRIERKGLGDFAGTLSDRQIIRKGEPTGQTPLRRFEMELQRAQEANLYVVMAIEANINDAQRFDYLPQTRWIKTSPHYIFKNLRDLLVKYPLHFQAVFIDGRIDMAQKIPRILQLGEQVKKIDLQYALEQGIL
jgi:hypothetical protein